MKMQSTFIYLINTEIRFAVHLFDSLYSSIVYVCSCQFRPIRRHAMNGPVYCVNMNSGKQVVQVLQTWTTSTWPEGTTPEPTVHGD